MLDAEEAWATERLLAGASLGRRSGRVKAVLVRALGEGWRLRVRSVDAVTAPAPRPEPMALAHAVADCLADSAGRTGLAVGDAEALGWLPPDHADAGLAEAALAEATGLTVVSGFAWRDLAAGGTGLPLGPVADALAFRSHRVPRLRLHLGNSLRVGWLPAGAPPERTLWFDAGPCCGLLDAFADRLSGGQCPFDPGGQFAVQGRHSETLMADWKSHPFLHRPAPRFLEPDDFAGPFIDNTLAAARELRMGARDVLCTATHFVAHALEAALRRFLPLGAAPHDVIVSGGGVRNGMVWKHLVELFANSRLARVDDHGVPSEALRAVHGALLGFCMTENLPGNLPALSRAAGTRILGRVTPGAPAHWERWVANLADRHEEARPRAAA